MHPFRPRHMRLLRSVFQLRGTTEYHKPTPLPWYSYTVCGIPLSECKSPIYNHKVANIKHIVDAWVAPYSLNTEWSGICCP